MRGLLVVWLVMGLGVSGFAQEPSYEPDEPRVLPAQFVEPSYPPRGYAPGMVVTNPATAVADPLTAVVRLQVRTPAHVAPGKPIIYRFTITNTSAATAYKIKVRHPIPTGLTLGKYEPTAEGAVLPTSKEVSWSISEMAPGSTHEMTARYDVPANVSDIEGYAYVSFEQGQKVRTTVEAGKIVLRKAAPQKASANDPITVSIQVTNTSRVAVKDIQVVETISEGFEFYPDPESIETPATPLQRTWKIDQLGPQQIRTIQYRVKVKPNTNTDFAPTSSASYEKGTSEPATSTTKLMTPKVRVVLTGDATATDGETASYKAQVINEGNMTLDRVIVSALLPADCRVVKKTEGGRILKNEIQWILGSQTADGPLKPGENYELRFQLAANKPGPHTIEVSADGGRGVANTQTIKTNFSGTPELKQSVEMAGISVVNRSNQITYRVKNRGIEVARDVVLTLENPNDVEVVQISPPFTKNGTTLVFDKQNILPNMEMEYTITYTPRVAGNAQFRFKLSSPTLARPLTLEKSVTVNP
ncbi:MAG: hypothetical protein ACRC8S_06075 [Fimbriiglobus sp.]